MEKNQKSILEQFLEIEEELLKKIEEADNIIKDDLGMTEKEHLEAELYWLEMEPYSYLDSISKIA